MFKIILNRKALKSIVFLVTSFICIFIAESSLLDVPGATTAMGIFGNIGLYLIFNLLSEIPTIASSKVLEEAEYEANNKVVHKFIETHKNKPILSSESKFKAEQEVWLTTRGPRAVGNALNLLYQGGSLGLGVATTLGVMASKGALISLMPGYLLSITIMVSMAKYNKGDMSLLIEQAGTKRSQLDATMQTGWDNIISGNSYNLRNWLRIFNSSLEQAKTTSIALLIKLRSSEAISRLIISIPVLTNIVWMVQGNINDSALISQLAMSLPLQMALLPRICGLSSYISVWSKISTELKLFEEALDAPQRMMNRDYVPQNRIQWKDLSFTRNNEKLNVPTLEVLRDLLDKMPSGRITLQGPIGSGKSTSVSLLKQQMGDKATYLPAHSKLIFDKTYQHDLSTGQKMRAQLLELIEFLEDINSHTIILDEWSANLDAKTVAELSEFIDKHAAKLKFIEIGHHLPAKSGSAQNAAEESNGGKPSVIFSLEPELRHRNKVPIMSNTEEEHKTEMNEFSSNISKKKVVN